MNFVVHPDKRGSQRTDADILAVRFPHRRELITSGNPLSDHCAFQDSKWIDVVIAEVKAGLCSINGPWTCRQKKNLHRTLYAMGVFEEDHVDKVADALYHGYIYNDETHRVRMFAVGNARDSDLRCNVVQITWDGLLEFIFHRFHDNDRYKSQHDQWDCTGRLLYKEAKRLADASEYVKQAKVLMGVT